MVIGCLGPAGTFSEQAAAEYIKAEKIQNAGIKCYNTIEDAISASQSGETVKTIAPVENLIEGAVNATMDALIFDSQLFIEAQLILPISQNMLVKKNFEGDIEVIMSMSHALAQCKPFIRQNYPDAQLVSVASTAEAARLVSERSGSEPAAAAIGNIMAANLYGLKIIHENIHENKQNITSFAILSKTDTTEPKLGHKTSIAFSTINKPGELYKLLDIFALWDLNMTKIHSRPMKGKPGEYVFYVDIDGYENVNDVKDALKMVARKTSFFKILGSYKTIII